MKENNVGFSGESFDFSTNSDINYKNAKKKFRKVVVLSSIIFAVIFIVTFVIVYKNFTKIEIEPMKQEVNATGKYLYSARKNIIESQTAVLADKKEKYILVSIIDNDGYISNSNITIYDDGTYLCDATESYNHNYRNERAIGNIDLTLLDNYVDRNKEILLTLSKIDYENKNDDNYIDGFLIKIDKTYVCGNELENKEVYNELFRLYNESSKEEIQKFDLNDKK